MSTGTVGASRPPTALRWRRSARRLTDGQAEQLVAAFRAVMAIGDDRGYWFHAGIHGLPRPMGCEISHGRPHFLPWHRAYLYFFERALRDQVPGAMLTWWDWRTPTIPRRFEVLTTADGRSNPLASARVDPVALEQGRSARPPVVAAERTVRRPGPAGAPALPDFDEVADALARRDFLDFSEAVEELHNRVHGWVGGRDGHMGMVAYAAYDPLFWAHHAMIDRLWRLWQLAHPGSLPPASLLRAALPPFPMTVEQTLDVTALGYDYASSTSSATG